MATATPQIAESQPALGEAGFAGLLASLAAPPKPVAPAWDELADDIATISYEQAVRTQARLYRQATNADAGRDVPASETTPASSTAAAPAAAGSAATPATALKRASITIRLSESECSLVHQRAAEAGLTVSAYLRSCTLEVESLRAQVKEMLAQLSHAAAASRAPEAPSASDNRPKRHRWPFLWPFSPAGATARRAQRESL